MKMETVGKEERLNSPKVSEQKVSAEVEDGALELEAQTENDAVPSSVDSSVLASMPCLLMELRRDSSESQLASTESDKPAAGRVDESDSSNHCMLSPSSSGHLADSDTLSSAAENEPSQADAPVEGNTPDVPGAVVGRKSRRSRSESETSIMAAKKNRQSSEKQNGKVAKVKGHRSQKHKERIRMLRQKREAAARKKYNLLQDSSTSDSDLTCDSSTSTSDDEEVSGSTKTITSEIPDGAPVVAHYDISDTNSDPEVVNMDNLLAAAVVQENKNSVIHDTGRTWRTRGLMEELNADTGHLNAGFLMGGKSNSGATQTNDEIRIASSDSEVEIVGVQEHARCAHPRAGVIQSVSSWKHGSNASYVSTLQTQSWATVAPQQHWSSPSEVVDLTLDEDSRRKYLL